MSVIKKRSNKIVHSFGCTCPSRSGHNRWARRQRNSRIATRAETKRVRRVEDKHWRKEYDNEIMKSK